MISMLEHPAHACHMMHGARVAGYPARIRFSGGREGSRSGENQPSWRGDRKDHSARQKRIDKVVESLGLLTSALGSANVAISMGPSMTRARSTIRASRYVAAVRVFHARIEYTPGDDETYARRIVGGIVLNIDIIPVGHKL